MDRSTESNIYGNIGVGLYDVPSSPYDTVLYYNPLKSNAIIFGASMSGKTVMLKNILARMNENEPYRSIERTYILDFGGNIGRYSELGRVCACFDNSNGENVKRIFMAVENELSSNSRALSGKNYLTYLNDNPDSPIPHITLIIENVTAFLAEERYENYHRLLTKFARDGLSKGISIILTANDCTGMLSKLSVYFSRKFALDMPSDKYIEIFGARVDKPIRLPGRGISGVEMLFYEFQAYLPFEDEAKELEALITESSKNGVAKIRAFPPELTEDNIIENCPFPEFDENAALLGLDYYDHSRIEVNFDDSWNIAIYGKKRSGKTNLLRLMIEGIVRIYKNRAFFIFYDDNRGKLKEFVETVGAENCAYCQKGLFSSKDTKEEDRENFGWWLANSDEDPEKHWFYIIRNKKMYSVMKKDDYPLISLHLSEAMSKKKHYILCDVPKITNSMEYNDINAKINKAFLLNTIGEFITDRGSSSVFNAMDPKEMKAEYADCDIGDAFCYDIDKEELQKFKVIKKDSPEG